MMGNNVYKKIAAVVLFASALYLAYSYGKYSAVKNKKHTDKKEPDNACDNRESKITVIPEQPDVKMADENSGQSIEEIKKDNEQELIQKEKNSLAAALAKIWMKENQYDLSKIENSPDTVVIELAIRNGWNSENKN